MADKVLDFNAKRKESIEKKRRQFERLLFENFLGAYTMVENDGILEPVTLVDISHKGCLFQVPWNPTKNTKMAKGTELKMRMYFSKYSYVPVLTNVARGTEFVDENGHTYMRYGCEFDTTMRSFDAVKSFIDFLYQYAEVSCIDKGDAKAFSF
jgi:hypothetical protein